MDCDGPSSLYGHGALRMREEKLLKENFREKEYNKWIQRMDTESNNNNNNNNKNKNNIS